MLQGAVVPREGVPFSEEKGRRQWGLGFLRVKLGEEDGVGNGQDVK